MIVNTFYFYIAFRRNTGAIQFYEKALNRITNDDVLCPIKCNHVGQFSEVGSGPCTYKTVEKKGLHTATHRSIQKWNGTRKMVSQHYDLHK